MYKASLLFKIRDTAAQEKHKILEMFFKSWVDDICNNEVKYTVEHTLRAVPDSMLDQVEELFRVEFDQIEDATAIKLKGIPTEFQEYIELIS